MLLRNILFLTLFILLFSGCDKEVYKTVLSKKIAIECMKIDILDEEVEKIVKESFKNIKIDSECKTSITAIHNHVKACQNPVANSLGSDFDGYVRFEVYHNGTLYYKIQQDYKSCNHLDGFKHIINILKEDFDI